MLQNQHHHHCGFPLASLSLLLYWGSPHCTLLQMWSHGRWIKDSDHFPQPAHDLLAVLVSWGVQKCVPWPRASASLRAHNWGAPCPQLQLTPRGDTCCCDPTLGLCPAPYLQSAAPSCLRVACMAGEPRLLRTGGEKGRGHPLPPRPQGWGVLRLWGITFFLVYTSAVSFFEVRLQGLQSQDHLKALSYSVTVT